MKTDLNLGCAEDETRVFQSALRRIFHGEPWEVVEPHARRAWTTGEFADGTTWDQVRDRIRGDWPQPE